MTTTDIIVPVGALGTGVREADLQRGLAMGAHGIALDAGSTDSGPYYLATGNWKYGRDALARDLRLLMAAQAEAKIPLLIGSCGTSGCDAALNDTRDIVIEIARERGFRPRIAILRSEQDSAGITKALAKGRVSALPPAPPLTAETIARCTRIVALMGPEPYIAALQAGADIVLGGRTTDTAVLAALPLLRGKGAGPAWHAGKTAECGGLCTRDPVDGGVMIRVGVDHFDVEPLSAKNRCDPYSVSAHMLYENSDPHRLAEPGGVLDVTQSRYTALDDRIVRVTGSVFEPRPYTMKLEGAGNGPFQTIMLVGITDPKVLAQLDAFLTRMHEALIGLVKRTLGERAGAFEISLRAYGWNATLGSAPPGAAPPHEIGLLFTATAATQALATQIARTCNPWFFHFPLEPGMELPSYAFPFSPAEIERGQSFEFLLNHIVAVDDPHERVRTEWVDLASGVRLHG